MSAAYLLDVNVLIALADAGHQFHDAARQWRDSHVHLGWATCPLTENALLRIMAQSSYPRSFGSPEQALPILRALRLATGHEFWPDEVTLADTALFPVLTGISSPNLPISISSALRSTAELVSLPLTTGFPPAS